MFQFPSFTAYTYEFSVGLYRFAVVSFLIRKSSDHCLFSGSPKLNAAIHILLNLSVPGHSPYALSSLTPIRL